MAILDATNVSRKRRNKLRAHLCDHPILYVECVNDNQDLLNASVSRKVMHPEFAHLPFEEAYKSFMLRIEYYKENCDPFEDQDDYVRIDSLNMRILKEQVASVIPYYPTLRDILVLEWVRSLFLVRHGHTTYNLELRIGGDPELTGKGWAQAWAMAAHFQSVHIPYIFTSTKKRTLQTAQPLLESHPGSTLVSLPEFDEIDAGECERMTYSEIRNLRPEVAEARARDKYNYSYPGGEGYATLRDRVYRGIKKALFISGSRDNILIIGHQAVNRMILSHFLYRRAEDVPYIYIPQDRYFHIISTQTKKLFELKPFAEEPD